MKIKMKVTAAGPDGVLNEGKEYDVDNKKGRGLVDGGYAVEVKAAAPAPVEEAPAVVKAEPETATVETPETATAPPTRNPSTRSTRRGA